MSDGRFCTSEIKEDNEKSTRSKAIADLVEVVSYDLPNAGPLQSDAVHVVVGDLHNLLQAEHARLVSRGQFIH